jgi:hypothetical protein
MAARRPEYGVPKDGCLRSDFGSRPSSNRDRFTAVFVDTADVGGG